MATKACPVPLSKWLQWCKYLPSRYMFLTWFNVRASWKTQTELIWPISDMGTPNWSFWQPASSVWTVALWVVMPRTDMGIRSSLNESPGIWSLLLWGSSTVGVAEGSSANSFSPGQAIWQWLKGCGGRSHCLTNFESVCSVGFFSCAFQINFVNSV